MQFIKRMVKLSVPVKENIKKGLFSLFYYENISMIMIKTIVCTGDSHTWGQGPKGVCEYFSSSLGGGNSVCAGDLRPVPFKFPCYVNLIRDEINKISGSSIYEKEYNCFIDNTLEIQCDCDLVRLFLNVKKNPLYVVLIINYFIYRLQKMKTLIKLLLYS